MSVFRDMGRMHLHRGLLWLVGITPRLGEGAFPHFEKGAKLNRVLSFLGGFLFRSLLLHEDPEDKTPSAGKPVLVDLLLDESRPRAHVHDAFEGFVLRQGFNLTT